jgi:hypothetical protein
MTPILGKIPMPVLYGVFLYMGFASLNGLQFYNRLKLMLMPKKYQVQFFKGLKNRSGHLVRGCILPNGPLIGSLGCFINLKKVKFNFQSVKRSTILSRIHLV